MIWSCWSWGAAWTWASGARRRRRRMRGGMRAAHPPAVAAATVASRLARHRRERRRQRPRRRQRVAGRRRRGRTPREVHTTPRATAAHRRFARRHPQACSAGSPRRRPQTRTGGLASRIGAAAAAGSRSPPRRCRRAPRWSPRREQGGPPQPSWCRLRLLLAPQAAGRRPRRVTRWCGCFAHAPSRPLSPPARHRAPLPRLPRPHAPLPPLLLAPAGGRCCKTRTRLRTPTATCWTRRTSACT